MSVWTTTKKRHKKKEENYGEWEAVVRVIRWKLSRGQQVKSGGYWWEKKKNNHVWKSRDEEGLNHKPKEEKGDANDEAKEVDMGGSWGETFNIRGDAV